MIKHTYHKCIDENCFVCTGGLASCDICGGAEGALTTHCYGALLEPVVSAAVYDKYIDYIGNFWFFYSREKHEIFHAQTTPPTFETLKNLFYRENKNESLYSS